MKATEILLYTTVDTQIINHNIIVVQRIVFFSTSVITFFILFCLLLQIYHSFIFKRKLKNINFMLFARLNHEIFEFKSDELSRYKYSNLYFIKQISVDLHYSWISFIFAYFQVLSLTKLLIIKLYFFNFFQWLPIKKLLLIQQFTIINPISFKHFIFLSVDFIMFLLQQIKFLQST